MKSEQPWDSTHIFTFSGTHQMIERAVYEELRMKRMSERKW